MSSTEAARQDAQPTAEPGSASPATPPVLSIAPLIALSLGYFLVMLDVTVVTVAVPAVRSSLHVGPAALQWIVDGYSTVFAGLLLSGGGLGDRLGHRRVFIAGLLLFGLASAGCALAGTPTELAAGRIAQGAGAALLVPTSLALLAAAYPNRAIRARALGIWGGIAGIAFAAGPLVGGILVSEFSWRAAFWINLPLLIGAIVLTLRYVPSPERKQQLGRMDLVGQLLGIVGLIALATGLNQASAAGWLTGQVLGAFAVAAVALTAFILVEHRTERARRDSRSTVVTLLPPSAFRRAGFSATAVVGVLLNLGYYGLLYVITLYFQVERGYDALKTGIVLLPSVCMALVAAPLSGRLAARFGPFKPMAAALLIGSVGFLGWLVTDPHTGYPAFLFALIVTGLATPLTVPAATAAIIESAPPDKVGIASAVFNVARQTGNAVGVALFGTLTAAAPLISDGLRESAAIAAIAFLVASLLAIFAGRSERRSAAA